MLGEDYEVIRVEGSKPVAPIISCHVGNVFPIEGSVTQYSSHGSRVAAQSEAPKN